MLIPAGCIRISPAPCRTQDGLPPGYARPVILHRAILGSVERMTGVLCPGPRADQRVSGGHGNNGSNATPVSGWMFSPDIPEYFLGKVV